MTSQQREQALTALAALMAAWQQRQGPGGELPCADSPMRFPFPAFRATLTRPHDTPGAKDPKDTAMTRTATTWQRMAPDSCGEDVRAGVRVRRSTDGEYQPHSIEAQDTRLAACIGSQSGWRRAAWFADDASGATTSRPGLQRAMAAARAGVIDVLLVYRADRLTRSLRDLVALLDDLDHAQVMFRSATEPFDTATAMGRMLVRCSACSPSSSGTPSSTGSSPAWNATPPPGNGRAADARSATEPIRLPAA